MRNVTCSACVDHPCARGESIGGCAEHGLVPMMVRMDFGSRSRENNDSDCNDVNIYGYEYDLMDERYIQRFKLDMSLSLVVCDKDAMLLQRNNLY
jgi:hypothetical protein